MSFGAGRDFDYLNTSAPAGPDRIDDPDGVKKLKRGMPSYTAEFEEGKPLSGSGLPDGVQRDGDRLLGGVSGKSQTVAGLPVTDQAGSKETASYFNEIVKGTSKNHLLNFALGCVYNRGRGTSRMCASDNNSF